MKRVLTVLFCFVYFKILKILVHNSSTFKQSYLMDTAKATKATQEGDKEAIEESEYTNDEFWDTEYEGAGKLCRRVLELRAPSRKKTVPYERIECSAQIGEKLSRLSSLAGDLKSLNLVSADNSGGEVEETASSTARQLAAELLIIKKLSYRGNNQHRHSLHFHKLREAQRRLNMLLEDCAPHVTLAPWAAAAQQAESVMRSAGATSIGQLRKIGIPSVRDSKFAMDQLDCMVSLASCVVSACEKVVESAGTELLGRTFFMPFSLITIAASSRVWVFSKYIRDMLIEGKKTLEELVKVSGIKDKPVKSDDKKQQEKAQPGKGKQNEGKPKKKEGASKADNIFATLLGGSNTNAKRKKDASGQQHPPKKIPKKK